MCNYPMYVCQVFSFRLLIVFYVTFPIAHCAQGETLTIQWDKLQRNLMLRSTIQYDNIQSNPILYNTLQ